MVFDVVDDIGVLVSVGFVDVVEVIFEVGVAAKNGVVDVDTVLVDGTKTVDVEDNKLLFTAIKK